VKGFGVFKTEWNGAVWQFANAQNLAKFTANPEKYAPQYGGYCAKALSDGNLASVDPNVWEIVDGKLYLNYSPQAQKEWETDIPGKIAKADKLWPKILSTTDFIFYESSGRKTRADLNL